MLTTNILIDNFLLTAMTYFFITWFIVIGFARSQGIVVIKDYGLVLESREPIGGMNVVVVTVSFNYYNIECMVILLLINLI